MRKLPLALILTLASAPLAAAEVNCPKESVVHGGIDHSLPCGFQSPLSWQDHRVMFARGSSTLDDAAKAVLDRQADVLRGHPTLAFTVYGHVDSAEAEGPNGKALGFQRANAVRDYLVLRGIAPERISTDSRGDHAIIPRDRSEATLAAMRFASTETEDNPRPMK